MEMEMELHRNYELHYKADFLYFVTFRKDKK